MDNKMDTGRSNRKLNLLHGYPAVEANVMCCELKEKNYTYVSRMLLCFESLCTQQWKRQDVTRVFLSPIWLFIWENKYLPWLEEEE